MDTILNERVSLSDDGQNLTSTIRTKKNLFQLGFFIFWLILWTFGGVAASVMIIKKEAGPETLFLIFWLVFWGFGWIVAILTIMWGLLGREIITASPGQISYRYEILGIGRTKVFLASNIEIFSIAPPAFSPFASFIMPALGSQSGGGPLWLKDSTIKSKFSRMFPSAFYPKIEGVVRMGEGLDISDAVKLGRQIKERVAMRDEQSFGF